MRNLVNVLMTVIFFCSCQSTNKNVNSQEPNSQTSQVQNSEAVFSWPIQMQLLTAQFGEVLPLLSEPSKIQSPESKKDIQLKLERIKTLAHNINEKTVRPDKDPSIKFISDRFEENIGLALESFQSGHYDFARSVYKNAMSQCVQCHTRMEIGPSLSNPNFVKSIQNISIVERIQLLIASRYFEDAINEINSAFSNGESLSIVAWQKLVQLGFVLHVRYKGDVKGAENFVTQLSKNSHLPYFIKRNLEFWNASLKTWKDSPQGTPSLKVANDLISKAEKLQKDSRSEGGTVDFLRGAHLLHQFLAKEKPNPIKAQALYHLGLIYENVSEIGAWSMNEDYYELCVRIDPHTEISQKCFARYQESLISGYSGTSGLYLPQDVQKKLNELRAIAL